MTNEEKIKLVKLMADTTESEEVLSAYLNIAGAKIINKAYPYGNGDAVPTKYEHLQCEIAVYLINKRGADYQTAHSENGIVRSYGSEDIPPSLINQVVPFVGVIS